jgi:outer membrane cobalamin receptor
VQTGFGPRFGIAYAFTPDIVAHAFAGLLWQPPPVLDTPAAARQLGVVTPDHSIIYDLRPEKDRYAELGVVARVIPQLTLGLTLWGKLSTDQLDDIEVGNTNLLSPYNFRDGRAAGIEGSAVLVISSRLNAFGNVTLQNAQGRGIATATYLFPPEALANEDWQTLDHSQTWTANTGTTFHFGSARLSGLLAYGSGLRTGPGNNQHVPDHVRVDLTAAYQFREFPGRPLLALDIVNVFDNHYAYRIANGFNGSHWAPGRSVYARLATTF